MYPSISAVRAGYNVQAVMDASGSPFDLSEEMSRRRMEREGVVLTATNTLMAELARDWSRPEGGQLSAAERGQPQGLPLRDPDRTLTRNTVSRILRGCSASP